MKTTMWSGYSVHGDAAAIDAMLEAEGMVKLDMERVFETLSSDSDNYVAVGIGSSIGEACQKAFENLPIKKEYISKLLIDFRCGTRMPSVNELAMAADSIIPTGRDTDVAWGITSDESLGDSYLVTLVVSCH